MSAPSTTSYYPFDAGAPAVFSRDKTGNYIFIAFLWLLIYDHAITLDKEVEWIWTLRWRLPKIIFLINRYIVTSLLILDHSVVLNFTIAELLLLIRVSSLYGHHKLFVWILGTLYVLALGAAVGLQAWYGRQWQVVLYYKDLPGCWLYTPGATNPIQWHMVVFLSVEGALMLLTAYKVLSYFHKDMNPAITVLARDSLVYFIIIFVCLVTIVAKDIRGTGVATLIQIASLLSWLDA
ncbi:hypothetical protein PILCRDRAFT_668460 [Piloderma croceum F 1598]|uniref:DUF6533 domain-containing protein n=1 Tax=Piloderma croceum (strain F 1598) TaxID=765440 RepID=A0A0C3ESX9_PILCF|nr:hypothetical protein PILCRDRAFT_668460 [Piloderma croceum F 1598]